MLSIHGFQFGGKGYIIIHKFNLYTRIKFGERGHICCTWIWEKGSIFVFQTFLVWKYAFTLISLAFCSGFPFRKMDSYKRIWWIIRFLKVNTTDHVTYKSATYLAEFQSFYILLWTVVGVNFFRHLPCLHHHIFPLHEWQQYLIAVAQHKTLHAWQNLDCGPLLLHFCSLESKAHIFGGLKPQLHFHMKKLG